MFTFIIEVIVINVVLFAVFQLYCKLTYGINKCSRHLVGKLVIVTGGNAGIGFEIAKDLAERGAKVIIACRDDGRGTAARDQIISLTDNVDVHYRNLDLASFSSIRKFADEINKAEKQIDILINNAGVKEANNVKSEDGLSLGMQINYFGPFLLTNLLLPLMKSSAPSRIVNVSAKAYRYGTIDIDNLNFEKETEQTFSSAKMYSNSKLCNVLTTVELARQLQGTGVTVNCLHPGAVDTSIINEMEEDKIILKYLTVSRFLSRSAWEGAQTTTYLAVAPEVSKISGCYFTDCTVQKTTEAARDTAVARKLWEVSERLVKLT